MRLVNDQGIALIKHYEGLYLRAYKDPVGIWTIGYGHTGLSHKDGTVHAGRVITPAQAEQLLRHDLNHPKTGTGPQVEKLVKVPINDDQFSALVSFAFNVGADIDYDDVAEGLGDSTLLKKLNQGDYNGAADEFPKWNRAGGMILRGLTRRRLSERALFLGRGLFFPK